MLFVKVLNNKKSFFVKLLLFGTRTFQTFGESCLLINFTFVGIIVIGQCLLTKNPVNLFRNISCSSFISCKLIFDNIISCGKFYLVIRI